jgi:hypothetical protein
MGANEKYSYKLKWEKLKILDRKSGKSLKVSCQGGLEIKHQFPVKEIGLHRDHITESIQINFCEGIQQQQNGHCCAQVVASKSRLMCLINDLPSKCIHNNS